MASSSPWSRNSQSIWRPSVVYLHLSQCHLQGVVNSLDTMAVLTPDRSYAYVFGNGVGERIGTVRKAWQTAVLKAHRHKPQ